MRVSKAVLTALALVAAGCGGSDAKSEAPAATATPNVVQPGAPGEPTKRVAPGTQPPQVRATEVDVKFMQDMIHHHRQALVMTAWVPERTASPSVKLLAERMSVSQEDEVRQMEEWLRAQGAAPSEHTDGHTMPGMLSQTQLDKLEAGDGEAFDRLFLRYMTQHHQGALTMVQQLRSAGGGAEPEIDRFARHVEADQEIEILRMQEMLRG